MLYENVKKTTVEMLQPIAQKLVESTDEELLKEITSQWTMEKKVIRVIKEILLYMDKNFAKKARNLMNVQDMQTSQFKKHVVLKEQIKHRLISLLLSEIERERNGETIERIYVQKVIEMLIEVGMSSKKIYEQEFETLLITKTREYYRAESNSYIAHHSSNDFLVKANQRLCAEQERIMTYLHPTSHDKVLNEFLREYISAHAGTLLTMENSGLLAMLKEDKFHDIKLMYCLFRRCPEALNDLKNELKSYIIGEGLKLVTND